MKNKRKVVVSAIAIILSIIGSFVYKLVIESPEQDNIPASYTSSNYGDISGISTNYDSDTSSDNEIAPFSGSPYVIINNNIPFFDSYSLEPYEMYSELDQLGRCGIAEANICPELMPIEKRGEIGMVKPAGWHTVKYDCVEGLYCYNRCHLIAYQLAAENANEKNLITGTRYLNVVGMLPFENEIADYVHKTGNHVMYRVTPIYTGDNLLCDGVTMEALSVEDEGKGVCFNVFCYNVQPGVVIDYSTGESWAE